jgi:hypothetical protein
VAIEPTAGYHRKALPSRAATTKPRRKFRVMNPQIDLRCRSFSHLLLAIALTVVGLPTVCAAQDAGTGKALTASHGEIVLAKTDQFKSLTEPPCSYCSTQHRKGLIRGDDRVVAWLRASHNGGAVPLRHFLSRTRVINDTYGLFFYDPDGGYVAAYRKDYGYELYGWRRGVMIVRGKDGTLWSALTGRAIAGPQQGKQLERIPSLVTDWGHWMMLHPESTAYDLFDGKTYAVAPLPVKMSAEAAQSMAQPDGRLKPLALVLGVEFPTAQKAYPLDNLGERGCVSDTVEGQDIAVFWYRPTQTAVAFRRDLENRSLTLYADDVSPESAPFKDKQTGSRWTLAGRAVDGPLRGQQLDWMPGIQCRWYAWSAEYPETQLYVSPK